MKEEINIKAEINGIEKIIRINKTEADSSNKLEHKQGRLGVLNIQRIRIRNE